MNTITLNCRVDSFISRVHFAELVLSYLALAYLCFACLILSSLAFTMRCKF